MYVLDARAYLLLTHLEAGRHTAVRRAHVSALNAPHTHATSGTPPTPDRVPRRRRLRPRFAL
jgi:hypothetical protein